MVGLSTKPTGLSRTKGQSRGTRTFGLGILRVVFFAREPRRGCAFVSGRSDRCTRHTRPARAEAALCSFPRARIRVNPALIRDARERCPHGPKPILHFLSLAVGCSLFPSARSPKLCGCGLGGFRPAFGPWGNATASGAFFGCVPFALSPSNGHTPEEGSRVFVSSRFIAGPVPTA